MGRFILRFTGRGKPPDTDLSHIQSAPGVSVLEIASPRMLLVEAQPETVTQLAEALPRWSVSEERIISLPDPRPKIQS
jgi:hypothetical protein